MNLLRHAHRAAAVLAGLLTCFRRCRGAPRWTARQGQYGQRLVPPRRLTWRGGPA